MLYAVAGLNHLIKPGFYLRIIPSWVPYHLTVVYLSGICEILFALLLLPDDPAYRRMAPDSTSYCRLPGKYPDDRELLRTPQSIFMDHYVAIALANSAYLVGVVIY